MNVKKEIRILGIDDAPFDKFKDKEVLIVGTIYRGGDWPDGVISTKISVDGDDATDKLTEMIKKTKHRDQLQIVMLDGIAFGGFNVVDIRKLHEKTKLPIITIMRSMPNFARIEKAIRNVPNHAKKLQLIKKAGKINEVNIKENPIFFQSVGLRFDKVVAILKISCTRALIPEPIRVAHLIASGVVTGESRGRA